MQSDRSTAENIRALARALGFEDWATGELGALEADVRSSCILKLSKELRAAAESNDLAEVLTCARAIVTFLEDREATS